jgi:hypothetical protein
MGSFNEKLSEDRFLAFAERNRLRVVKDMDKRPIAVSRSRKAHLSEGFYQGFGVSLVGYKLRSLNSMIKKLKSMNCTLLQYGTEEANLWVPEENALKVYKFLKIQKGNQRSNNFFPSPI